VLARTQETWLSDQENPLKVSGCETYILNGVPKYQIPFYPARQLIEPTTVDLKEAAEDVYDQLKEIGGDYATEAEEYLEDMFPEVFDEGITEKPLEHVDEAGVESNDDDVVEINKSHKHGHGKHNGTHGHNSTLPNGNGTAGNGTAGNGTEPIFVPQRYFTEPIITSLIIVFVILLPIVSIGIMALTSIQVTQVFPDWSHHKF
jgi:hypothetical protein